MLKTFTLGDTLRFRAYFRTDSGALFNPTSTWGKVFDPSSTVISSPSALTLISTGTYGYDWQTDPSSNAAGVGAFQAYGFQAGYIYTTREILYKLL